MGSAVSGLSHLIAARELDGRVAIRQDDKELSWEDFLAQIKIWRDKLGSFKRSRVAVATSRADLVAALLLAAEQVGCELLLLRSYSALSPTTLEQWGVAACLDEALDLRPTGVRMESSEGSHLLLATSGTSGNPKVAQHSLPALLGRIRQPAKDVRDQRFLLSYHPAAYGGLQVLLTWLAWGCYLAAVSSVSAVTLAQQALAVKPTHISGTPTFWRAFLLALGDRAKFIPLEHITLGGEIVDQAILDRLTAIYPGTPITHIYASTEAGAVFGVKDQRAGFPAQWLHSGVDGVELRVREGILEVRSQRSMTSYLAGPDPAIDAEGWLTTGDRVDVSGDRVTFLGRHDSIFSVGGAKVTPEEVEQVLLAIPGIIDCRVYPVPNAITGNIVGMDVVCDAGVSQKEVNSSILATAKSRLESYKVPRRIRFLDQIELSESKKTRRS